MTGNSNWQHDKQVARAILGDRALRRKWMARFLMLALMFIVLGLWVIDEWLAQGLWRFLLWWAMCGAVSLWLMLYALHDALMVMRGDENR